MRWFCLALLLACPFLAGADTWRGKVVGVRAGDVMKVTRGGKSVTIRLAGIEAPRAPASAAKESRQSLADLCRNGKARVSVPGRVVGGTATGRVACNWSGQNYSDASIYQLDQCMAGLLPSEVDPVLVRAQARARCSDSANPPRTLVPSAPSGGTTVGGTSEGSRCDGRVYCSQMTSCAEATFFLQNCPGVKMDGNFDGVPCEQQWCH